jgi:hypothetical protein
VTFALVFLTGGEGVTLSSTGLLAAEAVGDGINVRYDVSDGASTTTSFVRVRVGEGLKLWRGGLPGRERDFNAADNFEPPGVPGENDDVVIPFDGDRPDVASPFLTDDLVVRAVFLESGAGLDVADAFLTVADEIDAPCREDVGAFGGPSFVQAIVATGGGAVVVPGGAEVFVRGNGGIFGAACVAAIVVEGTIAVETEIRGDSVIGAGRVRLPGNTSIFTGFFDAVLELNDASLNGEEVTLRSGSSLSGPNGNVVVRRSLSVPDDLAVEDDVVIISSPLSKVSVAVSTGPAVTLPGIDVFAGSIVFETFVRIAPLGERPALLTRAGEPVGFGAGGEIVGDVSIATGTTLSFDATTLITGTLTLGDGVRCFGSDNVTLDGNCVGVFTSVDGSNPCDSGGGGPPIAGLTIAVGVDGDAVTVPLNVENVQGQSSPAVSYDGDGLDGIADISGGFLNVTVFDRDGAVPDVYVGTYEVSAENGSASGTLVVARGGRVWTGAVDENVSNPLNWQPSTPLQETDVLFFVEAAANGRTDPDVTAPLRVAGVYVGPNIDLQLLGGDLTIVGGFLNAEGNILTGFSTRVVVETAEEGTPISGNVGELVIRPLSATGVANIQSHRNAEDPAVLNVSGGFIDGIVVNAGATLSSPLLNNTEHLRVGRALRVVAGGRLQFQGTGRVDSLIVGSSANPGGIITISGNGPETSGLRVVNDVSYRGEALSISGARLQVGGDAELDDGGDPSSWSFSNARVESSPVDGNPARSTTWLITPGAGIVSLPDVRIDQPNDAVVFEVVSGDVTLEGLDVTTDTDFTISAGAATLTARAGLPARYRGTVSLPATSVLSAGGSDLDVDLAVVGDLSLFAGALTTGRLVVGGTCRVPETAGLSIGAAAEVSCGNVDVDASITIDGLLEGTSAVSVSTTFLEGSGTIATAGSFGVGALSFAGTVSIASAAQVQVLGPGGLELGTLDVPGQLLLGNPATPHSITTVRVRDGGALVWDSENANVGLVELDGGTLTVQRLLQVDTFRAVGGGNSINGGANLEAATCDPADAGQQFGQLVCGLD